MNFIYQQLEELLSGLEQIDNKNRLHWESQAVQYFSQLGLERDLQGYFKKQDLAIEILTTNCQKLDGHVQNVAGRVEDLIDNEFYKKRLLRSESNLSRKYLDVHCGYSIYAGSLLIYIVGCFNNI